MDRYMDFVIIIREGVYLPIERFNDFLFRQIEIINRFGTILRYSNKYWLSNPKKP